MRPLAALDDAGVAATAAEETLLPADEVLPAPTVLIAVVATAGVAPTDPSKLLPLAARTGRAAGDELNPLLSTPISSANELLCSWRYIGLTCITD